MLVWEKTHSNVYTPKVGYIYLHEGKRERLLGGGWVSGNSIVIQNINFLVVPLKL